MRRHDERLETVTRSDTAAGADPYADWLPVVRGSRDLCREYSLVLDAAALPGALIERGGQWELRAPASQAALVLDELQRYAAERRDRFTQGIEPPPFRTAVAGAAGYVAVLLAVAYFNGAGLFGIDWLAAGAIDAGAGARGEWWRAFTALTLHLDPVHLLGNLLFGVGAGTLLSRRLGSGVAWLSILWAGALANLLELWIAPADYRAAGASTAVFAALGLLSGYAWWERRGARGRWIHRGAPLLAGAGLLALLGAGNAHVDVPGHLLGFLAGVTLGSIFARIGMPRSRRKLPQIVAGSVALLSIAAAWALALHRAAHGP